MSDLTTRDAAAPATMKFAPLSKITRAKDLWENEQFKSIIARALPRHLTPDRMVSTFGIAVQKTPKLAQCSIPSLIGAFMSCSAMGLEPNTALQHAYLIPFDVRKKVGNQWQTVRTDVQLIVGYRGYLHLAYQNPDVQSIHCDVVWEGDEFSYEHGTNAHLRHVQGRDPSKRGEEPIFAYMHAKLKGGGEVFEVLTRADVHAARARSQGYQTAIKAYEEAKQKGNDPRKDKRYTEAPWIKDFVAMWRKTAMRAGQKWLPQSVVMAVAESLDDSRARFDPATDFKSVMDGQWEPIPEEAADDEDDGNNPPSVSPPVVTQEQQKPVEPSPAKATRPRTTAVERANTPRTQPVQEPARQAAPPPPPPEDEPPADRWGDDGGMSEALPPTSPPAEAATEDAPPPFEHYVFDAQGEMASDLWTNPIGFARQFAFIGQHVTAEEWPAFLEFNNDGIYEAREASREAADIIDAVQAPEPSSDAASKPVDGGPVLIPVREVRGAPDYAGWLNEIAPVVKALTAHTLMEWTMNHAPMVQTAPPTPRMKFVTLVSERATAIGIGAPPVLASLMPAARKPVEQPTEASQPPTRTKEEVAADALQADIAQFRTTGEAREWLINAAVKSRGQMIREARPDLNRAIEQAYNAKMAELNGGAS